MLLALCGAFAALAPVPLLTGAMPEVGMLNNLRVLQVTFKEETHRPYFTDVFAGDENPMAQIVRYDRPSGDIDIEFIGTMPLDEIKRVMKAGAKDGGELRTRSLKGSRLRFQEWIIDDPGIAFPYRYFLLCGLLLAFLGGLVAITGGASHEERDRKI